MLTCQECKTHFEEGNRFIKHVRLFHKKESTYKCGIATCLRVFSSIDSLRKHLKSKHLRNICQYSATTNHAKKEKKAKQNHSPPEFQASNPFESMPGITVDNEPDVVFENCEINREAHDVSQSTLNQGVLLFAGQIISTFRYSAS